MRRLEPADLMLLATVSIWAFNFTVTRYVLTHGFEPLAYASLRYVGAALVFAALTYAVERSLAVERRDLPLLLGATGLLWLNQIAFHYALATISASTAALVMGTLPIFTALIAWGVRLERLSARFSLASVVSFGGVALVAAGSGGGLRGDLDGVLLTLLTAATWAGYSVLIAPLMRRYSPYRISAFVLLAVLVPLLATSTRQVGTQDYSVEALVWGCLAFAILGPIVLTNVLWFRSIDRVGPSRATLVANLQPFLAAVFALAILSEKMTAVQLAGGGAIAVGIALAPRRRVRPAPPAE